jgi:hypothetical protein
MWGGVYNYKAPVLLRKEGSHYLYVRPCFVPGLVEGEAAKLVKSGKLKIEEFQIH